MTKRPLHLLGLGLLLAAPAAALVAPFVDGAFKTSDHEKIGGLLAKYFDARGKNEGFSKAEEEVAKELARQEKRLGGKNPLSFTADMGQALWASYDYGKNQRVKRGKIDVVEPASYFDPKTKLPYAVWTPAKYDVRKAYPVILCIPDQGETPQQHLTEKWVDSTIRDNAILVAVSMPADAAAWSDMAFSRERQTGGGHIAWTFREVRMNYAIDFDRVFLAGRGRGVEAALAFASRQFDRLAGVIGRTGDAPADLKIENWRNLPLYFAGAGGNATALESEAKRLNYEIVTRKDDATEADIWSWMQAHPRAANPTEVVLHPLQPDLQRAYWLEAVPTDAAGPLYVKAKIDKPSNTITVEGEGVTNFTIYFNDLLVDLDRPVKVVANGSEVSRQAARALPRMLDFIHAAKCDPGKMYVQSMAYDLPPKKKDPAKGPAPK